MWVRLILSHEWDHATWNGWRFLGWAKPVGTKEWAIWITR